MKVHGREVAARAKIGEVLCAKGCQAGTHVDTIWLPPGKQVGQVVGMFYVTHGEIAAPFEATRRPSRDKHTEDLLCTHLPTESAEPLPDEVEAWEVRWRWADAPALKNARLN